MEASELRKKSVKELSALVIELTREGFNLRMQRAHGHVVQAHRMRVIRKDLARVKTVIRESNRG